jgi:hypothetical protein
MNRFDYAREDIGNLVLLEHVNLTMPDQRLATAFFVSGLGLTRDPYLNTGVNNMWINAGRSQLHLPHGEAQRLRGHVGLILGERDALLKRLRDIQPVLADTAFAWNEAEDRVQVTCPWGNRYDCLDPRADARWSGIDLGIAYVQLDVPPGRTHGIAAFYRDMFDARVQLSDARAAIDIGGHQQLVYAETPAANPHYDGHHIQIYVADFSRPYARLAERGLTYGEEPHQYRFRQIVDPANGEPCFELEHEIRSLRHPLYARPLVNRNPGHGTRNFVANEAARRGVF